MSKVHALSVFFRRTFGWITSPEAWLELAALVSFALLMGLLFVFGGMLPPPVRVVVIGVAVLAAILATRFGWIKLLGPMVFYDMVRSGRRGRYILLRVLYGAFLVLMIYGTFSSLAFMLDSPVRVPQQVYAQLAQNCFQMLMLVQLVTVSLVTPAIVAGAIPEERDRRTMEYLLTTDLRNREIILSKLVTRLGQVAMIVLAGLPIIGMLQFFGGVSPDLILSGFAVTLASMVGFGGFAVWVSIYHKRPWMAIVHCYVWIFLYIAIGILLWALRTGNVIPNAVLVSSFPALHIDFASGGAVPVSLEMAPLTVDSVVSFVNSGNVCFLIPQVAMAAGTGTLGTALPRLVGGFAVFHFFVAAVSVTWATLRVRRVALAQASRGTRKRRTRRRLIGRRVFANRPLLWKELITSGGRKSVGGMLASSLLVIASFIPLVWILTEEFVNTVGYGGWNWFTGAINAWARTATVIVGCLVLLATTVRAATCISGERDRQTLDSLLLTPLSVKTILSDKFLGCLFGARGGFLWLGSIWVCAILLGGVSPVSLLLLVFVLPVYTAFAVLLGMWFSIVSRTTFRATVYSVLTWLGVTVGHWMLWACCGFGAALMWMSGDELTREIAQNLTMLEAGLTPQFVLGYAPMHPEELQLLGGGYFSHERFSLLFYTWLGTGFWAGVCIAMWYLNLGRFTAMYRAYDRRNRPPQMRSAPPRREEELPTVRPVESIPPDAIHRKPEPPQPLP